MGHVKGYALSLALHKYASNVVERCLQHGGDRIRGELK